MLLLDPDTRPELTSDVRARQGQLGLGAWHFPGVAFWATILLCLLALLPIVQLTMALAYLTPDAWERLKPQLPTLLSNSFYLIAGVAGGSGLLGIGLAWLTTLCEFPGRRFFSWALLLPLAIPAYVLGLVAAGLFDAYGPAFCTWRGQGGQPIPLGWLVLSLSLSLYPYVYLSARYAFKAQAGRAIEAARCLGAGPYGAFFRVALPIARPWIGASLALVALETLADLGTVSLFNYETFATAIYRAWLGQTTALIAAQLAGCLLLASFAVFALEKHQRGQQRRYQSVHTGRGSAQPSHLEGPLGWCVCAIVGLVLGLAFFAPLVQLLVWSFGVAAMAMEWHFVETVLHSLLMAGCGAILTVASALAMSLAKRRHHGLGFGLLARLTLLGQPLPGLVLAVGIAISLAAALDNGQILDLAQSGLVVELSAILSGTVLLVAYLVRFLPTAFTATDRAMRQFTPNMEETAHSLGVHGVELWRQVRFPLLRDGLAGAFLLTFINVAQELPITLLLRPQGWDTLATSLFGAASDGKWQEAALPALALVLAGLPPIVLLIRNTRNPHG